MYSTSNLYLNTILLFCESKIKLITNNYKINGFIIFYIHLLILFFTFYFLFLHPLGIMFYVMVVVWITMSLSYFYFNSYILTNHDRKIGNTNEWDDPFLLYCDYFNYSTIFLNNLLICKTILIFTIIFLRILFKY